jgi:signal transduction histidine kinase
MVVLPRQISFLLCGSALLLFFVVIPYVFPSPFLRTAIGDMVPLLVAAATTILTFRNAVDSRGHARLFWGLMAVGMAMWTFNQAGWAWFEVFLRKPLPDPFVGDVVLFLHVVPIMAAVALRPHQVDDRQGMLPGTLNVLILLVWWIFVYAFAVFPDEYIVTNVAVYNLRWDLLYLIEELMLIGVSGWSFLSSSGPWRKLYGSIFIASVVYTCASAALNAAIARGSYVTGGLYDVGFLAALLIFFWVALLGRRCLSETQANPSVAPTRRALVPFLAKLALLSIPVMGYWALFMSDAPPRLRQIRFAVAMGGIGALAFVVFLRQFLLDRRLVQLLKQSRSSYDNLHRLQRRVVQQAKLASLGELIALAAGELEHPLAAILGGSEQIATSNLSREQLSTARKIGQQARRTRELVSDLLSFAQRTPGEKAPLDLKPLLQRAVQMEGFKLENRRISLAVRGDDPLPRVRGNSNQLLQAFLQIIENAVDALQESGGGHLVVSLRREADEVVIEFADSGPGLRDPERVFDPFYTTKPVGKGTGLGLSATYGVVQDHHGQINCYNRPEGGATFEIRLPVIKTAATLTQAARAH